MFLCVFPIRCEESLSLYLTNSPLTSAASATSSDSSSTATGSDKVSYSMLKHLPRSGMDFLLHVFNLSWSLHSFPSIWKTSSIIFIHKMGKPLDSPASFRPISLTSCVSKVFERITLFRLLFLEWNSILSPRQAGFRPGWSTLDQIPNLSQSISDGFNKPRPGSGTILSTIDFSKAFDWVWHPALFHELISAGLPPCFARWTQSFLSNRRTSVVYQNHKSRCVRVRRGVPQGSVLGPVLFSLFINDLPASLPSVSCSLCADDLAIRSSSSLVPTTVEATQEALFRLERWSDYWCLPLNPSKCEASFSVDSHQANLLLLNFRLRFSPTPIFLGVTFDRTLSFTNHVSSLKAKFFPRLKALRCISASSRGPSKESLSLRYEAFLRPQRRLWCTCQLLSLWHWGGSSSQQAQYAQVSLPKPAPFCKLFAGLGSANMSATSHLFISYLTLAVFSPPCLLLLFYISISLADLAGTVFSLLSGCNESSDTRFSRGTTRLIAGQAGSATCAFRNPL